MYKLLLCWRYLRTRWIALASIVSVMLGVATMIVVNSVMEGFTHQMRQRIHGVLSDISFESRSLNGVPNAESYMDRIREVAGPYIAGMSPTATVPAMIAFRRGGGEFITRQVMLVGIDESTYASVSDFGRYLQHPENREQLSFELREDGYDTIDSQAIDPEKAVHRPEMQAAGWQYRRRLAALFRPVVAPPEHDPTINPFMRPTEPIESDPSGSVATDDISSKQGSTFNPATDQHIGCVLGMSICSYRNLDGEDRFHVLPGDDIEITYPSAGRPPQALSAKATIVDIYDSKMSEFDGIVFVPLRALQEWRGMVDPTTDVGYFNKIQIQLREDADLDTVRNLLTHHFPIELFDISTWRDRQRPILAAVEMEIILLNVLLFMIIAVAGFGILAIFFMIVVEKTRDIGILKSLGASSSGIMGIFLSYGLSLGIVGSGIGVVAGVLFVEHINEIAELVGWIRGEEVFDPAVYFFAKIPTIIHGFTISWVVAGAIAISVLASILPARRAAKLQPVAALRFE